MKGYIYELLLLLFIVFSGFIIRVYIGSMMEFRKAEKLYSEGMIEDALFHYERAIHWYMPVFGYSEIAAKRMWEIGMKAESEGNKNLALSAYQGLRSSFYSVRSFYQPGKKWIDLCDEKIIALFVKKEGGASGDDDNEIARFRAKLKTNRDPDPLWAAVSIFGLFGWISATVLFIWFGIGKEQKLNARISAITAVMFLSCYALWIIGMLRAH
ncbi:MAG: hypothetical protein QW561_01905 [Candidatus Aenigmatarchaeota archaeon]